MGVSKGKRRVYRLFTDHHFPWPDACSTTISVGSRVT